MGVLNLTPDSFSDGGKYNKKKAVKITKVLYLNILKSKKNGS